MAVTVASARQPDAGLTLIETMVALSLIALASGVVVAGLDAGSMNRVLEAEANTLALKLNFAVDEALVGGYPIELKWSASSYNFSVVAADTATSAAPIALARPIATPSNLPDRITLRDSGGAASVVIPPGLDGVAALLVLEAGQDRRFVQFDGYTARMLRQDPEQP